MNEQPVATCLNCNRSDDQVPLMAWRFQGRPLTVCPDCLPLLIHQREKIMVKWPWAVSEKPEKK